MSSSTTSYVIINPRVRISIGELRFVFSRSSGPGGQNVNKVSTRVTLFFDLSATQSLTPVQLARIRTRLSTRIDRSGVLRVVSAKHRTQVANRRAAVARLVELLADALVGPKLRKKTRVSRGAVERRLRTKAQRSQIKQQRQKKQTLDS